jgi:hypothetical protein
MATGTGLDAQFGLKVEGTYATPVTPDRFIPFNEEDVTATRDLHVSQGLVAGRLTADQDQAKRGAQHVAGTIGFDLAVQSQALIFKGLLGANVTAGSGPYTHTATPGGALPGHTLQFGRPDLAGTVNPFTYAGCKFNTGVLTASLGEIVKMKLGIIGGVQETTGTSLASASYATNAMVPFVFRELAVSVDGASVKAEGYELSIDNKLKERMTAGRTITDEPKREERMGVTGKITVELEDLTEHGKFVSGTPLDIVATFSDGTYSVVATTRTILQGTTPNVKGPGRLLHDLMWDNVFGDGTDADALTIVSTNADSAA